jgi:hypothetical protein
MVDKRADFGCASYVIGITSIVLAITGGAGIGGIILGIIGLVLSKRQNDLLSRKARKFSLIGIILGVIFFILYIISVSTQLLPLNGTFPGK